MRGKDFLLIGAISGGLAVLIGAFGAHWLGSIMSEKEMATFQTASDYHFWHSIMLCFTAYYSNRKQTSKSLTLACYSFIAGIMLFCFSLYAYAALPTFWMASIVPIGGVFLTLGWFLLAFDVIKSKL